jgi:hypothetical protein
MTIAAWQVMTWDTVPMAMDEFEQTITRMQHLGTSTQMDADNANRRCGQALWGGMAKGHRIGIAWDWAEVVQDVVAMSDPMRILSNIALLADDGSRLDPLQQAVFLNCAVHELHWQEHVQGRRPLWRDTLGTHSQRTAQRMSA